MNDGSATISLGSKSVCEKQIQNAGTACSEGDEQKVLGVRWNSNGDEFCFKTQLNFTPKIKKLRSGPNLTQEQVPALIPPVLTKRMVLSQINGIYDPLGLAAKILMRYL